MKSVFLVALLATACGKKDNAASEDPPSAAPSDPKPTTPPPTTDTPPATTDTPPAMGSGSGSGAGSDLGGLDTPPSPAAAGVFPAPAGGKADKDTTEGGVAMTVWIHEGSIGALASKVMRGAEAEGWRCKGEPTEMATCTKSGVDVKFKVAVKNDKQSVLYVQK
jgi:hypothetical protein